MSADRNHHGGTCRAGMRRRFEGGVLAAFLVAFSILTGVEEVSAAAPELALCTVRVGVSSFAEGNSNQPIINETVAHLGQALAGETVCATFYPSTELLLADMRRGSVDFFISSSGLYRRALLLGAKDLGVVLGPHVPNPNRAEGSVFLVLSDRDDIRSLRDARDKVLAANLKTGFSGFQTAIRELTAYTSDPMVWFRHMIFTGRDQREVLRALDEGRADVGAVKTCLLEAWEEEDPSLVGRYRVIDEKHYEDFGCRVSTKLYPNWVFAVMPSVDTALARRVTEALLDMKPSVEGLYWSIGTDFSEVDALMRDLHIGAFDILDDWSLEMLWLRYKAPVSVLLTLILGGLVHAWRTERLVRRRTAELTEAHEAERRLAKEARDIETKLAAVTKTAMIGQMSGMVAHELRQPLAAVEAYARGLERLSENGTASHEVLSTTLAKITRETARANAIVEKVRQYARSQTVRRAQTDPRALLNAALQAFSHSDVSKRVTLTVGTILPESSGIFVRVDPLEIELALSNLLKNAAEAATGTAFPGANPPTAPEVAVRMELPGDAVLYAVADNGPALDDEAFARLSVPLSSAKPEGLGLGLGIARSIAEAHGGSLIIVRREPVGVEARLTLPAVKAEPNSLQETTRDESQRA